MQPKQKKSFIKRFLKGIFRTIKWFLFFLLAMILLLMFRLSIEPIHIQKFIPTIVNMVKESNSQIDVSVSDAYLEMAFFEGRFVDICLKDVIISDKDKLLVSTQEAHVSFNPFALLIGRVVVTDVTLIKPFVQVNLSSVNQGKEEKSKVSLERKINRARRYFERLNFLSLTEGEINLFIDNEEKIIIPELSVKLKKQDNEIQTHVNANVYLDKTFMGATMDAVYSLKDRKATLTVATEDIDLAKFQQIMPFLKNIAMTIGVSVKMDLDLKVVKNGWKNVFKNIAFSIESKKQGSIYLPKPLDTTYPIENALISGYLSSSLTEAVIENSKIKLYGQTADVFAKIKNLNELIATKDFEKTSTELVVSLNNLGINDVPELWPSYLGSDVHAWIKDNVTDGKIEKASFNMKMTGSKIDDLKAVLDIKNAKVRYLDTMLPIEKVDAQAVITDKDARLKVNSALCNGVKITGGQVNFSDFDKDVALFDTDISLSGSLSDVLKVVSAKPLNVCDDMIIPCKTMKGNANAQLLLAFPFADDLEEKLTFSVKADIEDTSFPVPDTEWDFSSGSLKLQINNQDLKITGKGILDDKTVSINIRQSLSDDLDGVYEIKIPLSPSMIKPYFANIGEFFKGTLLTTITVYPQEKGDTISLDFGLKDAEISLPVGYVKKFNRNGTLKATLVLRDGMLKDISSVYLSIPEESIILKGRVNLPKNKLFELVLDEIKAPRTNAKLNLSIYENGSFDAFVKGDSLDIEDLIYGDFFSDDASSDSAKIEETTDFTIAAKLDKLYLSKAEPLTNVDVVFKRQKGMWKDIKGSFNTTKPFTFNFDDKKTSLYLKTEDMGTFLHRVGATDRISGGVLDTVLTQDKDGNLKGEINIKDFSLTKTSFFMQAATLLGIVDAIMGTEYISFNKAIIPFVWTAQDEIIIDDAVASGTSVGITMRGKITTDNVDLDGSVVPAYAVNSLLGNVPLVGTLFSGEKGGGLFGVTYTIKGPFKNVEFNFNPASLLAPGIFRRLF